MAFRIVGIEDINYISKKTNQQVIGKRIHYLTDIEKNGVGQKAENNYVPSSLAAGLEVGDDIEIYYNRFGSVAEIKIV